MRKIFIALSFIALLVIAGGVQAQSKSSDVQKVERYLNNTKTLKARFAQTAYNGNTTTGTFYLKRPGKLRFEYDAPIQDFIVADGIFIYYYDAEMKQQSNTTIGNSLADFLLRENITLDGDITVSDVKREKGLLQVTLVTTEDPSAGSLTLGFEEGPMLLKNWSVTDSQGLATLIELSEIQTGLSLSRKLFYYLDPEHGKPDYN